MRRLLEADTTRQLLELVAPNDELARQTVDVTEARLGRNPAESVTFRARTTTEAQPLH